MATQRISAKSRVITKMSMVAKFLRQGTISSNRYVQTWLYAGTSGVYVGTLVNSMRGMPSKNPTTDVYTFDVPDNQQETSQFCKFYYTGFCVGEMSCSLIRANHKHGVYYTPDFTIANADLELLREINRVIGSSAGIISPIKGGYNLKFRGKRRVENIFQYFQKYPVVAGDIAKRKLELLRDVLPAIGRYSQVRSRLEVIEQCRKDLKDLKLHGLIREVDDARQFYTDCIGYFLAGIIDAEGSCGLKKSEKRQQPFFAVAMKDRKIIYLLKEFLACGNIHIRSDDGLYHWETNRKSDVLNVIKIFTEKYPSKLTKMKERMQNLERFLNDYTPKSQVKLGIMI